MRAIRFISLLLLSAFASVLALPGVTPAQVVVGVAIHVAPPALPVYEQPVCPHAGFMWTPGYWAYGEAGYYWVPGTWVAAPRVGFLWTPGYWAWGGGVYMWHGGYWGPHIGFYGGVNYGFGIKAKVTASWQVRFDFRQYETGKPFDLPGASGQLLQNEISGGVAFTL